MSNQDYQPTIPEGETVPKTVDDIKRPYQEKIVTVPERTSDEFYGRFNGSEQFNHIGH